MKKIKKRDKYKFDELHLKGYDYNTWFDIEDEKKIR